MKQDQFEAFLKPEKPLPDGVLPVKYHRGTEIPFKFLRELGYWAEKGQGLSQEACEMLFVACGVAGRFGARYHATLPEDVDEQMDHARDFAYRLRDHLLKKDEEQLYAPNPALPGYLVYGEHEPGFGIFHVHDAWKEKPWNEQTAVEMFIAYGLDPAQARRWFAIYHHRTTDPRSGRPLDHVTECAYYAFNQGRMLKNTGKTDYRMSAVATIPAPVDIEWVHNRFRANKLWHHDAESFWYDMDKRNWSHEDRVLTPEELADMIDQACRAIHEYRSRPHYSAFDRW